jgi:hypothetical protein
MLLMLFSYVSICLYLGPELQLGYAEEQRIIIRSILYIVAIATMPLTNLIRHIMLRLNQTMPGETTAKIRYFITVLVSMTLVETIGMFGILMFILGDDYNTLYIFTVISILGLYIQRPKQAEYIAIAESLRSGND